jgi:membrane-associated phospholipid phosphatase
MLKSAAHFFSWIFQPLLMPLYGAVLFLNLPFYAFSLLPEAVKWYVISCNLLFTFFMPVFIIMLMKRFNMISSVTLENREDRKYPILFTAVFYISNYYFLKKVNLPAPYLFFLLAGMFSLISTLFITNYWKISMHMTGIGGLCGSFMLLSFIWPIDLRLIIAALFLVAGIVGSSRLILNVHTPAQVAAGFAAGFAPQISLLLML